MSGPDLVSQMEQQLADEWHAMARAEFLDTYVYRYYDAQDRLLYVGSTRNLDNRARTHAKGSVWHADSVRREVEGPYGRQRALGLEQLAIMREKPLWNRHTSTGYSGPGSNSFDEEFARRYRERMETDPEFVAAMVARMREAFENLERHAQVTP